MDARRRFGYAFLVFALGNAVDAASTAIADESTLVIGLDVVGVLAILALAIAFLTGRAGTDASSKPQWLLRYGPPFLMIAGLAIGVLGLMDLLVV